MPTITDTGRPIGSRSTRQPVWSTMHKVLILGLTMTLALAACESVPNQPNNAALAACDAFHIPPGIPLEPAHSECMREYHQQAAQRAVQNNDAATQLMVGSMILNGGWGAPYRYQQPAAQTNLPTITNCQMVGTMLQCNSY